MRTTPSLKICSHNFVVCIMSFFAVLSIASAIFSTIVSIQDNMNNCGYILLCLLLAILFGTEALHYGSFYIAISDNKVNWKKEKFVTKNKATFWQKIFHAINGGSLVSTIVEEDFQLSNIKSYGLLDDYKKIKIEEIMRYNMIQKQILVFELKTGEIFYTNVHWFSKRQIRKILQLIKEETGIPPNRNSLM